MTTAAEDRDAITAAIQVAATNDLVRLDAFAKVNLASFSTLSTNIGKLAGQMSNLEHADRLLAIQSGVDQALADFDTLFSITSDATNSKE